VVVLDHIGRPQVLVIDRVVGLFQVERHLMVEVSSLMLHLEMRLRQQLHRRKAAMAPLLAA
jgi:hypothetical protein